jgi:transposase-like protein
MPWKAGTMSELRANFVHEVVHLKRSVAAACRKYGVSRKTGFKWMARYKVGGVEELVDRSRRPERSPRQTASALEQEVLSVRDRFGWGAGKIWDHLRNEREANPQVGQAGPGVCRDDLSGLASERTIGNILRRHGRIGREEVAEIETVPLQFFERSTPHELWQCDFKGPLEVERRRVHPFTVLDDHSRYLLALRVCLDVRMQTAWEALWSTFEEHGLPEKLLCDGAFAGSHSGIRTLSWIEGRLIRLGIDPIHGRPYHPQTQGKVERLHGTLEREVWPHVDSSSQTRFAAGIERWRREVYNPVRPHEALSGRPPLSRYGPSSRARPSTLPKASYASGSVLRRVANGGDISWRGCRILVGAGLNGEWVRIEERDHEVGVFFAWKEIRKVPTEQLARGRLL